MPGVVTGLVAGLACHSELAPALESGSEAARGRAHLVLAVVTALAVLRTTAVPLVGSGSAVVARPRGEHVPDRRRCGHAAVVHPGRVLLDAFEPLFAHSSPGPDVREVLARIDFEDYTDVFENGLVAVELCTGAGIRHEHVERIDEADVAYWIRSDED